MNPTRSTGLVLLLIVAGRLALLLIVAGVVLAALFLGGCDDSGRTCTTPGPADGPSPAWSFKCEMRP